MIDSQPSASKPRNVRPRAGREPKHRRDPGSRGDVAEGVPLWRVQLELAPSEIGLVYRQGLARGAEVCRRGSHDWRPLLTTPELHAALVARASWPELEPSSDSSALTAQVTVSQRLAIRDPALAALLLVPARPTVLPVPFPPPPPVLAPGPAARSARSLLDSISDSAVTEPMPARLPFIDTEASGLAASFTAPPPVAPRVRSRELTLVAAVSVLATLAVVVFAQRASHWGEVRAPISDARSAPVAGPALAVVRPMTAAEALPTPSIPVIRVADLPVESAPGQASRLSLPARFASGGWNRAEVARALVRAGASARRCGKGPVHAQVVATFAPSGVPRALHFGSSAPPAVLRSCVLNAVARARVAPFLGAPLTVSKFLSW